MLRTGREGQSSMKWSDLSCSALTCAQHLGHFLNCDHAVAVHIQRHQVNNELLAAREAPIRISLDSSHDMLTQLIKIQLIVGAHIIVDDHQLQI